LAKDEQTAKDALIEETAVAETGSQILPKKYTLYKDDGTPTHLFNVQVYVTAEFLDIPALKSLVRSSPCTQLSNADGFSRINIH